jgi:hypothetical protein
MAWLLRVAPRAMITAAMVVLRWDSSSPGKTECRHSSVYMSADIIYEEIWYVTAARYVDAPTFYVCQS